MAAAGRGGLNVADVFQITADTASNLDGVSTTGWDLLIGKSRANATNWIWRDSAQGISTYLKSNATDAAAAFSDYATLMTAGNGILYRAKIAPKFFDVVTYTGDGVAGRTVAHNLGAAPGMIVVKAYSGGSASSQDWFTYHRSIGATKYLMLNSTNAEATSATRWNNTAPTDAVFTVGTDAGVNENGTLYVAYLFAHDDSASGIIQCGSYTGNGSSTGPVIDLGWEPQWLLTKRTTGVDSWWIRDSTRDGTTANDAILNPSFSAAEQSDTAYAVDLTSSGFQIKSSNTAQNNSGDTYVYAAIRAES